MPVGPGEQVAVRLTSLIRRSDTQVDFVLAACAGLVVAS